MVEITKQENTAEFKELTNKGVRDERGIGFVAQDVGLVEHAPRNWVKADPPGCTAVTAHQTELSRVPVPYRAARDTKYGCRVTNSSGQKCGR